MNNMVMGRSPTRKSLATKSSRNGVKSRGATPNDMVINDYDDA